MNIDKLFPLLFSPRELVDACLAEGNSGFLSLEDYLEAFTDEDQRKIVEESVDNFFEVVENPLAIAKAYWIIRSSISSALNGVEIEPFFENRSLLKWHREEYYRAQNHIKYGLYYDDKVEDMPVIDLNVNDALMIYRIMSFRFKTFAVCQHSKNLTFIHMKGFSESEVKKLAKENPTHRYI